MTSASICRLLPVAALLAAGCVADPAEVLEERKQLHDHTANAQAYLENGDLARAQQQAERALAIDDEHAKARLILANVRFLMAQRLAVPPDQPELAPKVEARRAELVAEVEADLLAVTDDASRTDVAVFKAYYVLGDLHFWRHQRALRESVRLQRLGRPEPEWMAHQDEADRLLDLAVRHYQNALLTSHERFDAARARLVETLFDRGRKAPKGRDYDTALRQAGLYIDKALTDQQVLRERIAQEIPKEAGLTEPQRAIAVQKAQERLKELEANVVRMRQQRARLHARREAWDAAAAELEQAVAGDANNSLLYFEHALALAQAGELARAQGQLVKFAELRRRGREGLREERQRAVARGGPDREQAVAAIDERLRECDADEFRVALDLALLDCRLGRYIEARRQLDPVLVREPESVAAVLLSVVAALEAGHAAGAANRLGAFEAQVAARHPDLHEVVRLARDLAASLTAR